MMMRLDEAAMQALQKCWNASQVVFLPFRGGKPLPHTESRQIEPVQDTGTAPPYPHLHSNNRYISQFDWEIHIRARNKTSGLLYYSSTQERLTPKLVAYHPSVPLHLAHNLTAFQVLLRGLAQVRAD